MDERIIKHFHDAALEKFIIFCADHNLKPSAENMLKYLIQFNLINEKDIKRYFVIDLVDRDAGRNKTGVIRSICDEFKDFTLTKCWSYIKHHSQRFKKKKDLHLL